MDDLILAARLLEKGDTAQKAYIPNLRGQGKIGSAMEYGKNLVTGAAGALMKPVKDALDPYAEAGMRERYGPGLPPDGAPVGASDAQNRRMGNVDPSRIGVPAPTAPTNQPANLPQEDTDGDGQLTVNDTIGRKTTTEVDQQLDPTDGSVASTTTNQKTVDTNLAADNVNATTSAVNSPDPNTNATPAPGTAAPTTGTAAPAAAPTATGTAAPAPAAGGAAAPTATTSNVVQDAAGLAQVQQAQKRANTGLGGFWGNVAGLGLPAMYGAIQRFRGNKQLGQLANQTPGAGGASNANMIRASRADGTEFLNDYWVLQKSRMEARERGTTEAIRNAYR